MISDKMIDWFENNLSHEYFSDFTGMEKITKKIDWQHRFQDFTDRNLKSFIDGATTNDAGMILSMLTHRAYDAGSKEIAAHLMGYQNDAQVQKEVVEPAKKMIYERRNA